MKAASSHHPHFFVLTIAAAIGFAATPPAPAATYSLSTFDRLQGVIVYEVHEDSQGGIWLGTEAGIWRWHANGFMPVSSPTVTTAPSQVPAGWGRGAITIASDSTNQTLWIGTGGGLLALDMNSLEPKAVPVELQHARINRLHAMPQGEVWAASTDGLYKLQWIDGKVVAAIVPESRGLGVTEFLQTKEALWVGTDQELLEITQGRIRKHFENEVEGGSMHLLCASDGAMWMGLRKKPGLYRWDAAGVRKFGKEDGLLDVEVNTIAERGNGEIWVGTERGAYRYLNGRFICINRKNGLEQDDVHSIRVDREDEIWIGTFGGGVYLLRSPDVLNFSIEDGLSSTFVSSMCLSAKNTIVAGSLQGYSNFDLTTHQGHSSELFTHVRAAAVDKLGRVWLGGRIFAKCLDTGKTLELPGVVQAIAFDADGNALVGCAKGLFIETDQGIRQINITEQAELAVNAILVESDGSLVVGTGAGLFVGTENNWRPLPMDSIILSLARSTTGDYWVGTTNSLKLISRTTLETLEEHGDLRRAQCIIAMSNGLTWCGTEEGLLKIHGGVVHRMTLADGLPSSDVRGLVAMDDGTLYAGTTAGLAQIDTQRWKCRQNPPRIELEFWSLGETLTSGTKGRLAMSVNDQGLVAEVSPRGQRHSVGMRYQYRIPGPMDSWSEWIAHSRIIMPHLKAGAYSMHVRGRSADGMLSNEATAEFEITAPLWQTTGFLAASGGGVLLALGGGAYLVRKRTHYRRRIEHSERKYRTLVESLRVIPYQADARTGEFRYVGPQSRGILGHDATAWLLGGKRPEMIPYEDASIIQSLWVKSQAIRGHCMGEHRLTGANGEVRWFRNIVGTGENETDSIVSGLMIDITAEKRAASTEKAILAELESAVAARTAELTTAIDMLRNEVEERRRAETALRQSEDQFSKIFNRSPVAMVLSTLQDGIVLDVNEAQLQISGFTREDLIGKRIADVNAWADSADRERFLQQLQRDGSVSGFIAKFYSKDRRLRVGRIAAECIEHNGQMCLLSAGLDITDSHAIEKELEQQRRFLRQLLDINPHFIFAKDVAGRFTLVNKAVALAYGTTVENLIGKTDADFNQNQAEVAFFRAIDQEVIRSGQEHRVEEVITDSAGRTRRLDTIKLPLHNEKGEAFGILGVSTDITARKIAEEALRRANDDLELRVEERTRSLLETERQLRQSQKLEAVGTLSSGIAHQFDNLLTAISAYADLAKTTLPSNHQAVRSLEKVEMTARHARGVTNSLLTFSHQSGGIRSTLNLSQVVDDTLQMLGRVLNSRISIEAESITDEPAWVSGDQTQIEQMLLSLAINAQDAMPNGGRLRVSLSVRNDNSNGHAARTAVLAVADTGTGIAPENLPRIFEPFFTTKPRGQGTGLGLSIILGIVKEMGGHIQAESDPGIGTMVTITVPCCEPPAIGAAEPIKRTSREVMARVIVIERNPHVRSIITTTLRAVGCDVCPFSRVSEALAFASSRPSAGKLIVVDMDSVSPAEFAKLSAMRERNVEMKMIVIVGTLNIDLKRNRLDDCLLLRKPFEMPELTELVEDCLDGIW